MKSLVLAYSQLARAQFMVRALVGLLTFATAVLIEVLLDVFWTHFHIDLYTVDRFVQAVAAPIVGLLIAPILSSLVPLFHGAPSGRVRRFDCDHPFDRGVEVTFHALRHDDFDFQSLHDEVSRIGRDGPNRAQTGTLIPAIHGSREIFSTTIHIGRETMRTDCYRKISPVSKEYLQ
jgi:hypothetical protein